MEKQPKFRLNQVVMLLDHNPESKGRFNPNDQNYRIETGKFVQITKVVKENWNFSDTATQFSYEIAPGYGNSFFDKVHEVWLRSLTGEEITGRI